MKHFDRFIFWLILGFDVVCAVLAAVSGKYLALIWIVSSISWMCRCHLAEKSRDEWFERWERAVKGRYCSDMYCIECRRCLYCTMNFDTKDELYAFWNTRPAEDELKAKNKELVETVSGMEKTIGRAEKVLGERNLLAAEVERLKAALEDIKDRLLDRTCLNFGEAMVAQWLILKVNEILSQAPTEAIDIHEAAYAPDTNVPTKESEEADEP